MFILFEVAVTSKAMLDIIVDVNIFTCLPGNQNPFADKMIHSIGYFLRWGICKVLNALQLSLLGDSYP